MSQNARVALWVPTATPPDAAADVVRTTGLPDSIKRIPTAFALAGGGGGGGIEEAPIDGAYYSRRNAAWAVAPGGGGGGITDAPVDGQVYVRQDGGWVLLAPLDGGTF